MINEHMQRLIAIIENAKGNLNNVDTDALLKLAMEVGALPTIFQNGHAGLAELTERIYQAIATEMVAEQAQSFKSVAETMKSHVEEAVKSVKNSQRWNIVTAGIAFLSMVAAFYVAYNS